MADFILNRSDIGAAVRNLREVENEAHVTLERSTEYTSHGSALPATVSFALIDCRDGLNALGADWNALFATAGRPEQVFQTFAWNWHWSRHYVSERRLSRGPRLAVVTGRRNGRLVLVMPLVTERVAGLKQLAWIGAPVSQYGDVLAAPEASGVATLAAAWSYAVAETGADLAKLNKVRADAVVAPLLAHLGAAITATEEAPYLDFTRAPDHATFEAGLSAKGRKNRRRHMRRLAERGSVTFEQHASNDEASRLAGYAILLKRAWLKSRDRISLAMADDRFLAFFADVAAGGPNPVACKVLGLRTANELGALQVVFDCKGQRFLHVAVYVAKHEKCGVGGLLLEHTIVDCFEDNLQRLDLLAPKHEYKMEFADGSVAVNDHAVALSLGGRLYAQSYLGIRRRLKALAETMPAPARRALAAAIGIIKR